MRVIEVCENFDLALTKLREVWISRDTVISDFLNYLVKYQGKINSFYFKPFKFYINYITLILLYRLQMFLVQYLVNQT